jgi:hypothetical protein
MTGFWEADEDPDFHMPVTCNDTNVKITIYAHPGSSALVAAANFGPADTTVSFQVDYNALSLKPDVGWRIPAIPPFQSPAPFSSSATVTMEAQSGGVIILLGA